MQHARAQVAALEKQVYVSLLPPPPASTRNLSLKGAGSLSKPIESTACTLWRGAPVRGAQSSSCERIDRWVWWGVRPWERCAQVVRDGYPEEEEEKEEEEEEEEEEELLAIKNTRACADCAARCSTRFLRLSIEYRILSILRLPGLAKTDFMPLPHVICLQDPTSILVCGPQEYLRLGCRKATNQGQNGVGTAKDRAKVKIPLNEEWCGGGSSQRKSWRQGCRSVRARGARADRWRRDPRGLPGAGEWR